MKILKISIVYRIILVLVLFITLLTTVIYLIIKPNSLELLSKESWCVDKVYYRGVLVGPQTRLFVYMRDNNGNGPCTETAYFYKKGDLELPGLNSYRITGKWKMDENDKVILLADTARNIFDGKYDIDVSENELRLNSATTIILAHKDKYTFPNPMDNLLKWRRMQRRRPY